MIIIVGIICKLVYYLPEITYGQIESNIIRDRTIEGITVLSQYTWAGVA
jgi:hypothetical protein